MARHKWNGRDKGMPKGTSNNGGITLACLKCGCVKEYVQGRVTYFIDDSVYHKAPKCTEAAP